MQGHITDVLATVSRLESLLASARLSRRDADRCARLADALRRPVRICLLGVSGADIARTLDVLIGQSESGIARLTPALEIQHGPKPMHTATLGDGSALTFVGWPASDFAPEPPVFLRVEAPIGLLHRMSFLALTLDREPHLYRPAMTWAAGRSEIAVWCGSRFGSAEARIWSSAPDRLRNHAYLLELKPDPVSSTLSRNLGFVGRFSAGGTAPPQEVIGKLLKRLDADIEEARAEDVDATRLFLHRLGLIGDIDLVPNDTVRDDVLTGPLIERLSEPLLYLKRRARVLAQDLAWMTDDEDWPGEVLTRCEQSAEWLCNLAASWPSDSALSDAMRSRLEEMRDTLLLLQIEAGPASARDAAALMEQMRWELEQALTPGGLVVKIGRQR